MDPSKITTLSSTLSSTKPHLKSTPFSSSPLFSHSGHSSDPAGLSRASIIWFRNDLRLHDNEILTTATNESLSVLPVYCFDPRLYGKSPAGFNKTGPTRATFIPESVAVLRCNLRSRGSDLVVRIGTPEIVLVELTKAVGAEAVYVHREVSCDEVRVEEKFEAAVKEQGVEVKYFWGSTLCHIDDLPFKLEEMPSNYGGFRESVKGINVRKTTKALDQLKGLPTRGDVEAGEIPTLLDLGLSPTSTMPQDGKPSANACFMGGETEALKRLLRFASDCVDLPNNAPQNNSYFAKFSCNISPWLAMGCLSPRFMFDELKEYCNRMNSAASTQRNGAEETDNELNSLKSELLWRDFFRFITKKYSSSKEKLDDVPVTTRTGTRFNLDGWMKTRFMNRD
ncbi:blue-light photoreceptor PHR2-like [Tasmannia lanceolata]|uniref:blue-light photoreceptor PHR2-like n=1 Tax=Tasmannia lanceolata TaxID=3420 RepID=UPI004063C473